jgi:type IV secretion system protein VirB1
MVMAPADFDRCGSTVAPVLMQALVRTESGGQPLAIGMDRTGGGVRQPQTLAEAVATAKKLAADGKQFSVGLAQVHVSNVRMFGMSWEQAFDACQNLAVGQKILWNFFHRARAAGYSGVTAIWAALRGYNSGDVRATISDEYANRIFAYMSTAPASVQLGLLPAGNPGVPGDSTSVPTVTAVPTSPQRNPAVAASTEGAGPPEGPATSGTPDIFEKAAAGAGL